MWPFKKRKQKEVPSTVPVKAPVKEVVEQLMRLSPSQWHDETEQGQPAKRERYTATSHSGWNVAITREESRNPAEGEILKITCELFVNGHLVGNYFACEYAGGGKFVGGDVPIHDLYLQVNRAIAENRNNSREWRAAKEQQAVLRHKKQ